MTTKELEAAKLARQSDKKKLQGLARDIDGYYEANIPSPKTGEGQTILDSVTDKITEVVKFINEQAEKL